MSAASTIAFYVLVSTLYPDWKPRRIAENCRRGKIPGAVKRGNTWMILSTDIGRDPVVPSAPTVEEALADLKARGVL